MMNQETRLNCDELFQYQSLLQKKSYAKVTEEIKELKEESTCLLSVIWSYVHESITYEDEFIDKQYFLPE